MSTLRGTSGNQKGWSRQFDDPIPTGDAGLKLTGNRILLATIVGLFAASFGFHRLVVAPCIKTTKLHTVTDNLGRFYQTEYEGSGEWCLWVRSTFQ